MGAKPWFNFCSKYQHSAAGATRPQRSGDLASRMITRAEKTTGVPSGTLRRDGTGAKPWFKFCSKYQHSAAGATRPQRSGDLASRMITRAAKTTGAPSGTLRRDGTGAKQQIKRRCRQQSAAASRALPQKQIRRRHQRPGRSRPARRPARLRTARRGVAALGRRRWPGGAGRRRICCFCGPRSALLAAPPLDLLLFARPVAAQCTGGRACCFFCSCDHS